MFVCVVVVCVLCGAHIASVRAALKRLDAGTDASTPTNAFTTDP